MALIFNVGWGGIADIRVFDAGSQGLADLLVWRCNDQGLARGNDGAWCFVESSGLATTRVWFVDARGSADLVICFVSSQGLLRLAPEPSAGGAAVSVAHHDVGHGRKPNVLNMLACWPSPTWCLAAKSVSMLRLRE